MQASRAPTVAEQQEAKSDQEKRREAEEQVLGEIRNSKAWGSPEWIALRGKEAQDFRDDWKYFLRRPYESIRMTNAEGLQTRIFTSVLDAHNGLLTNCHILTLRQRDCCYLHFQHPKHHTYEEVGALLGWSKDTVERDINDAIDTLTDRAMALIFAK